MKISLKQAEQDLIEFKQTIERLSSKIIGLSEESLQRKLEKAILEDILYYEIEIKNFIVHKTSSLIKDSSI